MLSIEEIVSSPFSAFNRLLLDIGPLVTKPCLPLDNANVAWAAGTTRQDFRQL